MYDTIYVSDSGNNKDLDQVAVSEIIVPDPANPATGYFKGIKSKVGRFEMAYVPGQQPLTWSFPEEPAGFDKHTFQGIPDVNGIARQALPGGNQQKLINGLVKEIKLANGGRAILQQYFVFYDFRTGLLSSSTLGQMSPEAVGVRINESGFEITQRLDAAPAANPRIPDLWVQKTAKAVQGVQPGLIGANSSMDYDVAIE